GPVRFSPRRSLMARLNIGVAPLRRCVTLLVVIALAFAVPAVQAKSRFGFARPAMMPSMSMRSSMPVRMPSTMPLTSSSVTNSVLRRDVVLDSLILRGMRFDPFLRRNLGFNPFFGTLGTGFVGSGVSVLPVGVASAGTVASTGTAGVAARTVGDTED